MKKIALVGAPNSGKTSLYNWLTGSRFKTVNYPGATVEYAVGQLASHWGAELKVIDTPGLYSLDPKSADEEVTRDLLFAKTSPVQVDGVLLVLDGTQLERHLNLALQIKKTGLPFAVALTMSDLLERQALRLDLAELSRTLGAPVVLVNGLLAGGIKDLIPLLADMPLAKSAIQPPTFDLLEDSKVSVALARKVLQSPAERRPRSLSETTRRLDRFFLHPVAGILVFFLVMAGLFSSIYWAAQPFMELVESGFAWGMSLVSDMIPGLWGEFLADGVLASFAAVFVFVPQIFILFVGIGFLEASGYLARAASLVDRPFSWLGLTGRSFVPILSGFSCAVPALIATRNLSSPRDRWITAFVVPLMTCSARLPVYALLLGFLFMDEPAWKAGLALAGLYFGALFVGAVAAAILNRILPKEASSHLVLELPLYRRPRARVILRQALAKTGSYVKKAGPVIFVIAVLLWGATNFPRPEGQEGQDPGTRLSESYAGQVGHWIEPIFSPMGVDWRVGLGLMSAFAAREVFVSSLAVTFQITEEEEEAQQTSLLEKMQSAQNSKGELIFTPASVWGLLVFFLIALQCMSTFAMALRETGSSRLAWTQLIVFNLVAYGLAVLVFQVGSRLG